MSEAARTVRPMSMNGEYLRVTPAELGWALGDSACAWSLSEAAQDVEEQSRPPLAEARHFTTHKTWHLLDFLMRRAAFPVDLVHGVDPDELTRAEIYPQIWDSPAALEWARDVYASLTGFFRGAASAGDAMLVWID